MQNQNSLYIPNMWYFKISLSIASPKWKTSFSDSQIATTPIKMNFYNFFLLKLDEKYNRLNFDNWHFLAVSAKFISETILGTDHLTCRGGYGFFLFRIFFSANMRVRIFIFFVVQSSKFFPEFNIRFNMTKTLNQIIIFLSTKIRIFFFRNIGNQNILFRKKP